MIEFLKTYNVRVKPEPSTCYPILTMELDISLVDFEAMGNNKTDEELDLLLGKHLRESIKQTKLTPWFKSETHN